MKVALLMIICSSLYRECLPPQQMTNTYNNFYDCLLAGYEESIKTIKQIGSEDINKNKTSIRFICRGTKEEEHET